MSYPKIRISLKKIKYNTKRLVTLSSKYGIKIAGVTKVFCAYPKIAKALVEGGVEYLADSRIENLKKIRDIDVPKMLLRLPMISQAEKVVELSDVSLNSELATIKELSKKALEKGKQHKIILMIDLGDLREGIFEEEEIFDTVEIIMKLNGVKLIGIGTNLTCYGGVMPSKDNLGRLTNIARKIESKFKTKLDIISGGNSSSIYLMEKGDIPEGINQLRLGESIILGRETAYGENIEDTYSDCFKLIVEIIEIKEKPSVPIGEIGMDAFGNKPTFEDKGIRKRAICAIGKQDVNIDDITADDTNIEILGASSDHLILDITDSTKDYKVGDKVTFNLAYGGILSSMTSEYVHKEIK
ncbi:ornithine racemase Orr [Caldisalinibacter kiritimatiensis]|uniref:Ornithine racemase n=1 Tax=Caldisalinibacter kiritimatiensis TaxID=1304284 RepID=R1CXQ6_9FIRM|nr:ornithine racemase Orr [Caldisalinibacter kiritimatiensis]EOD01389.1 Ornithine racemase [Caldisalinibacter kiritimatiensis]